MYIYSGTTTTPPPQSDKARQKSKPHIFARNVWIHSFLNSIGVCHKVYHNCTSHNQRPIQLDSILQAWHLARKSVYQWLGHFLHFESSKVRRWKKSLGKCR
mmetsp:Transcript_17897/g.32412  ORF Transcript_17897/g.32412 Transcript_17897/m.32412 type:complete len:101 (+) Transcript_17897:107-409(+)